MLAGWTAADEKRLHRLVFPKASGFLPIRIGRMINILEIIVILLLLAVSLVVPGLFRRPTDWLERRLRRLGNRRRLAVATVALTALTIEIAVGVLVKIPDPAVHDEFAYLLIGDTFAEGRLTNPPHPLADFFKTYYILQQPTYQAKYPPGQGVLLAFGQVVFGYPIVGVWLSVAVACGAVCWMLQGWLPPRWAMLGGLLAAFSYSVLIVWGQNYWGGALAMTGGALVYGGLPRILRNPRVADAIALGIGVAILANSRPYEGLLACLPAAFVLFIWLMKSGRTNLSLRLRTACLPVALVLYLAFGWTAFYNYRVTGDALKMPYQIYTEQRFGDSLLTHKLAGNLFRISYAKQESRGLMEQWFDLGYSRSVLRKLLRQWGFYMSPALIPALFMVPVLFTNRRTRFWCFVIALVLVGILIEGTAGHTHYSAPVASLIFAVIVQGLRRLRMWQWQGKSSGRSFAPMLPLVYATATMACIVVHWSEEPYPTGHGWSLERARIADQLRQTDQRHVVIVRYSEDHVRHYEWVFNRADIDHAKIVWAHDLGPQKNRELFQYFSDREFWVVEADEAEPQLRRLKPLSEK